MLLAMDLGQREEDLEKEQQTVGALWRVTCCIVALCTLVFLEELVMDTLDLREYLQVAIKVEGANLGRIGRPVCLPTVGGPERSESESRENDPPVNVPPVVQPLPAVDHQRLADGRSYCRSNAAAASGWQHALASSC